MLSLLAVTVLTVSPASPRITHARLSSSDAPIVLVSDDAPQSAVETMTREQLEREYVRLQDTRPSLVLPFVVGGIGLILLTGGLEILVRELSSATPFLPVAITFLIVGGIGVAVGVVLLILRLNERHTVDARMDAINKRLDTMQGGTPPGGNEPPPPPPPPSALNYPPPPVFMARVATF
ncbi:MAG: hypothetical protein QM723_29470 [Myxococcaceae bacterium]